MKPLLLYKGEQEHPNMLNLLLPEWPKYIFLGRYKKGTYERLKLYKDIPAVLELPRERARELGASGFGTVIDRDLPPIESYKKLKGLEICVAYYMISCLSNIIKKGLKTLEEVSKDQYDRLSSMSKSGGGVFLPDPGLILSEEECKEKLGIFI